MYLLGLFVGINISNWLASISSDKTPEWLAFLFKMLPFQLVPLFAVLRALKADIEIDGIKRIFDIPQKLRLRHFACVPFLLVIIYLLATIANCLMGLILQALDISTAPQGLVSQFQENQSTGFRIVFLLSTAFVAPICEEILMRIVLFRTIRYYLPTFAAFLTSLAFAAMHLNLQYLPALWIVGYSCQMARRHGGLPAAIALHALYNFCTVLTLWLA